MYIKELLQAHVTSEANVMQFTIKTQEISIAFSLRGRLGVKLVIFLEHTLHKYKYWYESLSALLIEVLLEGPHLHTQFSAVAQLHQQNHQRQTGGDKVGNDDGPGLHQDAVNQPKRHARREQAVHAQRNAAHIAGAEGVPPPRTPIVMYTSLVEP